ARARVLALVFSASVLAVAAITNPAWPQARTIRLINPFPPGGTGDIISRLVADQIGRTRGVTIVIDNRPGGGTVIGTEIAARAPPDGNTLALFTPALVINPHLRKQNYNALTSFEPICNLVQSPQLLAVNAMSPYRTMADLMASARAKPGELTLASTGPATQSQIGFERVKSVAHVPMTYVPFPGNAPTVNAVLGGHVTAGIANYSDLAGHFNSGTLRPLATLTPRRIEPLPELPTAAEGGYREFEYELWFGMFAPARTPKERIAQLTDWFTDALKVPEVREKLTMQGLYPVGTCGADFARLIRTQFEDYGRVIREANIKGE
ncbi:MAG: hypothetical protein QOH57_822, partial [Mycobacterium sp.]|nr:hypothetical protein [Mycobacterium sp.]